MEYTFRKLCAKDIFPMANIISKIGVNEIKNCFESEAIKKMINAKNADTSAIGISIAFDIGSVILNNLPKCQNEIFAFLADITGVKAKDIENATLPEFAEMIFEFVKKEEFRDFIGVVSRYVK